MKKRVQPFLLACMGVLAASNCKFRTTSTIQSKSSRVEPESTTQKDPLPTPKVVVLAGGGREGDVGDVTSWSYESFKPIIENGDVNQDGLIRVAVLTTEPLDPKEVAPTEDFFESYFPWIASTLPGKPKCEAKTLRFVSKESTNDTKMLDFLSSSDAVFFKGGDQGEYYDLWNNTSVEQALRTAITKGAAVLGTSAGSMSQAGFAFAGGKDLISEDVMVDSMSPNLDDASEGEGVTSIKTDFLSTVPNTVVDTHFTERGRLGRLLGIMAKVVDENKKPDVLAIGIDRATAVVIQNGIGTIQGKGAVWFLKTTKNTKWKREKQRPLLFTNIDAHRLTKGWKFDLKQGVVVTEEIPSGGHSYNNSPKRNSQNVKISGPSSIRGDTKHDDLISRGHPEAESPVPLAENVKIAPEKYGFKSSPKSGGIPQVLAITNTGGNEDVDAAGTTLSLRSNKDESLFQGLSERPGHWGFLLFGKSDLWFERERGTDKLVFGVFGNSASIAVDTSGAQFTSSAGRPSTYGIPGDVLEAKSITHLKLHVLSNPKGGNLGVEYDTGLVREYAREK